MRIVVASDRFGSISSRRAGELIAGGWPQARTRVLAVGDSGAGFVEAYAERAGGVSEVLASPDGVAVVARTRGAVAVGLEGARQVAPGISYEASSIGLGRIVARLLSEAPARLYVDLGGFVVHDGGAGFLAALGAVADRPLDRGVAGLEGLSRIDLAGPRRLVGATELVGVVPEQELAAELLGLRGITARLGHASGEAPDRLLAADAALARWAAALGGLGSAPGAGACGGQGLAVLALGGRLMAGPQVVLEAIPAAGVDLVLTGCPVFDFGRRGGGVVSAVARWATAALAPCVLLAGRVLIGSREMRTMGIEAAYPVRPERLAAGDSGTAEVSEADLASLAHRVARSWRW